MTGSGADGGEDEPEAFFAHSTVAGSEKANSTHTRAAINFKNELMFITNALNKIKQ